MARDSSNLGFTRKLSFRRFEILLDDRSGSRRIRSKGHQEYARDSNRAERMNGLEDENEDD
jgi:hypothetical protein